MDSPARGPIPKSQIENSAFLLSRLGFESRRRFAQKLDEMGLRPQHYTAMSVLQEAGAASQQYLASTVGTDPSDIVATIDHLESRGDVERRRDQEDRRRNQVYLTAKGAETLETARSLALATESELLAPLSSAQRGELHALLALMMQNTREGWS